MAKRSRRPKQGEDVQPANHVSTAVVEQEFDTSGPGYAEFEAHIDCELESLVARWLHVAAPGSATFRRVVRQAKHQASDQV